ncbi:MAG TPA: hypothetical protein VNA27_10565 [Rubrobacteraceae bacterium]|nr:hypothetical protein [Rubrobacteraceae bacterium]
MTSDKQIQANRRNALKSTGPKTPEGKDAVRLNANKHGLRSQEVLLPGEDAEALEELDENLRTELQPVGELENLLVDGIIAAHWRLRRLRRVEAGIFTWELYGELTERAQKEAQTYEWSLLDSMGSTDEITDKQKHEEALAKAQEMKAKQDAETATLGRTFMRDADQANAFSKLSRYETAIWQSLYKALHELQRLQTARHTKGDVLPPIALDVDVSGVSGEGL